VDYVAWNETVGLLPPVEDVAPLKKPHRPIVANDPLAESQWALNAIHATEAHEILRDLQPARKARVAILDTGVDGGHEDLQGIFERSPANVDKHGHGTHCAGIAGAATNNQLGMASLNWDGAYVEIMGYQALGSDGLGSLESIAQAIIDAANDQADVISMSLGGFSLTPPKVVKDAVRYALKKGAIVVTAAGNSNQDARNHMPSNVEGVITVSAVDQNLNKAKFSNINTGLKQPIAAPGVDIVSLVPDNQYAPKSGTSMATPLVSGLLGVMRALDPDLSAAQAYTILHQSGIDLTDSDKVGRMIDAEEAIKAVLVANASL
jgi:thermitase